MHSILGFPAEGTQAEMEFIILSLTKLIIVYFLKNLKILMAIMTLFDRLSLYCGEEKNLFLFLAFFFFWK